MRRVILGLVAAIFSVAGFAEGGAPPEMQRMSVNPLMRGKVKTDKTIRLEKMMNASPDELFQMWTTEIGVHAFFAPASKIEPKAGGAYTIIFDPVADPNGDSLGTNGARILEFERPGKLSFEWISFRDAAKKGADGPPAVAASMRNKRPIPTWVEIEFAAVAGDTMKTDVKFAEYGFKSGREWDAAFNYSKGMWGEVLEKLTKWAEMPRVASGNGAMRDTAPDSSSGIVTNSAGSRVTIADFAFLGGRWTGTAGSDTVEQVCTPPARGAMSCVFRSMSAEKIDGLELTTLRETASGLEERVRFFSPELAETAGDEGITMRVARVTDSEIVFDNAKPSEVVKHVTILRRGKDSFGTRIEVVDASGKSGFIVAEWKRAK